MDLRTAKSPVPSQIQDSLSCGRWDLNPHKRNAYKILSLARLPVPTLPHTAFLGNNYFLAIDINITKGNVKVNTFHAEDGT